MNYDEALRYLLGLGHETLTMKLGLSATEKLLAALGSPHKAFAKVQIAGTNGKGSTAVMLQRITHSAGIRTGLYTSPHLINITERIRIGDTEISTQDFARYATTVRNAVEDLCAQKALPAPPTFFEQITAIALVAFREAGVPLAILETGLGGRLDATTAAHAEIAAITPIALDHQEYLGNTLAAIASEKAAVIRPGITSAAVIAPQAPEALNVILERCRVCNLTPSYDECVMRVLDTENQRGRLRATFATPHDTYENVLLALHGRHQTINASVAIRLAETLRERGFSIAREQIIEGLEKAFHAGRLEWRDSSTPAILFDGAHNAAGGRVLHDYLKEFVKAPVTLIFGAMRDKDLSEMASVLFPVAHRIVLTQPENPRAATLESIQQAVPPFFDSSKLILARTAREALNKALETTPPDGVVCVSGSLYLIGEIQNLMCGEEQARALP
ncbi:MAG: folylpolyglutamate synthase/dihydrofolate synthase family protein [Pyrinomonadaceae bacterium]